MLSKLFSLEVKIAVIIWYMLTPLVSLQQGNVKKSKKSMKIANIEGQHFHIFWTTQGILMEFSGKMWLMIILKVHSCRYENLVIICLYVKNCTTQIAHYNIFHFFHFWYFRFAKCMFTNIQKQLDLLKSSLIFNPF